MTDYRTWKEVYPDLVQGTILVCVSTGSAFIASQHKTLTSLRTGSVYLMKDFIPPDFVFSLDYELVKKDSIDWHKVDLISKNHRPV